MKHLKTFESIRDEFPGMFEPRKPEDRPKSVPGFEGGTIDPDDDDVYGDDNTSDKERYKTFLKVVKERNFEETENEIKVNLKRIDQDYCMSIYNYNKHMLKFLNEELSGMYIADGLINVMNDFNIEGIIEEIVISYHNGFDYSDLFNMRIKQARGQGTSDDWVCMETLTIDKIKSSANKYNL